MNKRNKSMVQKSPKCELKILKLNRSKNKPMTLEDR